MTERVQRTRHQDKHRPSKDSCGDEFSSLVWPCLDELRPSHGANDVPDVEDAMVSRAGQ
jgi:hypothetical protein